ncbi:MAG: ATP-binding protein [Pyrobaculum sp.]|jgi:hypothetical protein
MWNVPREGFHQLYEKLPGAKPPFDDVWRWTGGNPEMLARLYKAGWDVEEVVLHLMQNKKLSAEFTRRWRRWLEAAVEDPDVLWTGGAPEELVRELEARNLIVYNMYYRRPSFWVDAPPPERDPELGIGKNAAWQTPIHREAVGRALRET